MEHWYYGPVAGGDAKPERIAVGLSHFVEPNHRVNPLYINKLEQIQQIDGSPLAIPFNLVLL